jgi:hypothetical protein
MDCWQYNKIDGCKKSGKKWWPAMVLQAIPVTGAFGAGFGNLGRWDIFNIYMAIAFGPLTFLCIIMCWVILKDTPDEDNVSSGYTSCVTSLISFCWSLAIASMWIWGIVVIANNEIKAPWTDYKGNNIECFPI